MYSTSVRKHTSDFRSVSRLTSNQMTLFTKYNLAMSWNLQLWENIHGHFGNCRIGLYGCVKYDLLEMLCKISYYRFTWQLWPQSRQLFSMSNVHLQVIIIFKIRQNEKGKVLWSIFPGGFFCLLIFFHCISCLNSLFQITARHVCAFEVRTLIWTLWYSICNFLRLGVNRDLL